MSAPQWLKDRMDAVKNQPAPSTDKVQAQFEACARIRKENAHCPKHKEYDMVNPPQTDCSYCWDAYVDRHQTTDAVKLLWEAMDKYDGLKL